MLNAAVKVVLEPLHYYSRFRAAIFRSHLNFRIMEEHRRAFYARLWREAANYLNADIRCMGGDFFEVSRLNRRVRVWREHTSLDCSVDRIITMDKAIIAGILSEFDVPQPRFKVFGLNDLSSAKKFMDSIGGTVAVKPAGRTGGGTAVTTNVTTTTALARAMANARVYGSAILIEEQIEGENYRLLYLDGELVDCVWRKRPAVKGDGTSTVRQAVETENKFRLAAGPDVSQNLLPIDLDMGNTLAIQGVGLSSVLPPDQVVMIRNVINQNRREDNLPVTGKISQQVMNQCQNIVRKIGLRITGIDIITKDPSVPLDVSGGVFLEINTPPGLYWHTRRINGADFAATEILRRALGD